MFVLEQILCRTKCNKFEKQIHTVSNRTKKVANGSARAEITIFFDLKRKRTIKGENFETEGTRVEKGHVDKERARTKGDNWV